MTLDEIVELLNVLPEGRSASSKKAAFDLIASIGRPDSVRGLLASIESNSVQLERIARQSFRHTNHFDKIVLIDDDIDSSYRLTLHLWRPPYTSSEVEDEQIHDHRNDFWSTILFGVLESWEFVRSEDGEQYYEVVYHPARSALGAKVNVYSPVGPVGLRFVGIKRSEAGSTYYLPHEQIHRIAISQMATATLLLKGPHITETTSLFSTAPGRYQNVEMTPFDESALRERFDFIRRGLP